MSSPATVGVACHYRRMADLDRRSDNRRAQIVVRMSHAERDALHRIARREGTTITDLVRDRVADLLPSGKGSR